MKIHRFKEMLFVGPPLEKGPLPALFYFALSARDSLQKDPFNQPIQFLEGEPLRIFSATLPAHDDHPPEKVMPLWAKWMKEGKSFLPPFIDQVTELIKELKPHITKWGVAGLSRGAFIACHVAAHLPEITHILGFAPLTKLTHNQEFSGEEAQLLDLEKLAPKIYDRKVRFYIGNHDTRVGTENASSLILTLAKKAHQNRIRSAPLELIIGPSIGYQGHGTSPEIFKAGALWMKEELLS